MLKNRWFCVLGGSFINQLDIRPLSEDCHQLDSVDTNKERNYAVDILKAIAIIGVLTIHSCSGGYSYGVGTFNWGSAVFWGTLTRASVPVFLMCSGALLLDPKKEISIRKLYSKNLLRIVAAMFFWAMSYKIYGIVVSGGLQGLTFQALLKSLEEVILLKHEFHFYYLHIIILVYVFLPVTRILTHYASKRELQYCLAVWFALGIVYPIAKQFWPLNLLSGIPSQWLMNMTYASIGYGILGYYIQKQAAKRLKVYLLLFIIGFAGVFGSTWIMSVKRGTLYQVFLEGMSPFVALMAIGIFGLVTDYVNSGFNMKNPGSKIKNLTVNISNASFCIYLVHVFFIYIFRAIGFTVGILPCLISIPLLAASNFLLSYIMYLLLSRIPVVNKYLI